MPGTAAYISFIYTTGRDTMQPPDNLKELAAKMRSRPKLAASAVSAEEKPEKKPGKKTYTCQDCGKQFLAWKRRDYCDECAPKHRESKGTKACESCGATFEAKRYDQKYCENCRGHRKREHKDKSGEVKCVVCGAIFMAKNAETAKYCPECQKNRYKLQKEGYTEPKSDNQKMVKMRCQHCERIFETTWELYRKGRKYCTHACSVEAAKKKAGRKYEPVPVEDKPVQVAEIPYEPTPWQREFHNNKARFRVLCCGTRAGKDRASINEFIRMFAEMLSENRDDTLIPRVMGWLVAPTFPLARQLWRELKYFMPEQWVIRKNEAERQMETIYDGLIEVKSADDPDALVAVGLDVVVITEASRVKNMESVWANIRSRLSSPGRGLRGKGGLAIINSTPKGRGYFYRMYQWGQDPNEPDWISWHFPTAANPYIRPEEIESARRSMPERLFRQEYLAEFLNDGGEVFPNVDDVCKGVIQEPESDMLYVASWDPAQTGDWSGFSIRNERGEQVYLDRWTGVPWTMQLNKIEYLCKRYNYAHLDIDATGLGQPLPEAAMQRGLDVTGHYFSNQFKEQIINNLALLCEQKGIVLIDNEVLKEELKAYEYVMTKTGKIRYSHPPGGHDDMVTATALNFKDFATAEMTLPWMGFLAGVKKKVV